MKRLQAYLSTFIARSRPVFQKALLLVPMLIGAPAGWAAIAVDDFYVVAQDSVDNFFDVLRNDQLDTSSFLTPGDFTLVQGQGTISDPDGLTFTPDPGFSGTVVFNYTVADETSTSGAQVAFLVEAQSSGFEAVGDLFFVASGGQPFSVFLNVMENDVQPPSGFATITEVTPFPTTPLGGSVQIGSTGTGLDYFPPANVDGLDIINYTIADSESGETRTATVTIQLSSSAIEDGGIIQFGSSTFNGIEGGNVLITLTRTSGSLGAAQVQVDVTDSGALNGTDYDFTPGTIVSWADGEAGSKVISVPVIDDGVAESPEQFIVSITDIIGARFNLGNKAMITIADAPFLEPDPDFVDRPLPKPEQQKVANALDQACAEETTEINCTGLRNLSDEEFQNAVEQILPRKAVLQAKSVGQVQMGQRVNLRGRLKELRTGRNRISVTGLNMNLFGQSVPLARAFQEVINDELRGGSAGEDNVAARESGDSIADTGKWGLFLTGNVTIGKADDTDLLVGYDQDGKGITAGFDYRFQDNLIMGGALGYSTDDIDFELNSGEQQTESLSYSFFGNWYPRKELYVDWLLMVTDSELDVERVINITSADPSANIQGVATSKPESLAWTFAGTAGWNWALRNAWQVDAYLRLEYTNTTIDKYREQGGAGFALAVDEQTTDQIDTALGSRVSYTFSWSKGVLVPGLELEWVHVYADNEREVTARLIRDPLGTEFSAEDEELDNDYLNASFSLSALFSGGRSGFFRYETVANSEGLDWDRYSLGVRWEF